MLRGVLTLRFHWPNVGLETSVSKPVAPKHRVVQLRLCQFQSQGALRACTSRETRDPWKPGGREAIGAVYTTDSTACDRPPVADSGGWQASGCVPSEES